MLFILSVCQYEDFIASNNKLIYELEKSCKEVSVAYFNVVNILAIFWRDSQKPVGLQSGYYLKNAVFGMWRSVDILLTDVSEESIAFIFRVE
jgi:hypothetical protein